MNEIKNQPQAAAGANSPQPVPPIAAPTPPPPAGPSPAMIPQAPAGIPMGAPPPAAPYYGPQGYGVPPYVVPQPYAAPQQAPKIPQPFTATRADALFTLACALLGYLFAKWFVFGGAWEGWGITLFTGLYVGIILLYAKAQSVSAPKTSWFWMGMLLLTSFAFALWPCSEYMGVWRNLLLMGLAVYWPATLFGGLLAGRTGNFLPLDIINLAFIVPFRNFALSIRSFKGFAAGTEEKEKNKTLRNRILSIGLGLLICIPLLAVLLPLLLAADGGLFGDFLDGVSTWIANLFDWDWFIEWLNPLYFIAMVPVAMFLCGMLAGLAHKRYTKNIDAEKTKRTLLGLRIMPVSTAGTVMMALVVLYLLFIGFQIPYFFSAFSGVRPAEYTVYSEYARDGFFELCRIAGINMAVMLIGGTLSRKSFREHKVLRIGNIALSVVTLLLLVTAFSKMLLYIEMNGFTQKRIMTCVFMAFLAGVYVAVIFLQFKSFSIMRFSAVYGVCLLCALCLCNLDGIVMRYNANRYLNGTLPDLDTRIAMRSGAGGFPSSLEIYLDGSMDADSQQTMYYDLRDIRLNAFDWQGTHRDCLAYRWVRAAELPEPEDDSSSAGWPERARSAVSSFALPAGTEKQRRGFS